MSVNGRTLLVLPLVAIVLAGAGDRLGACGPFPATLIMGSATAPVDEPAFARGDLGFVSPTFARRNLVQAYRRLTAVAPANDPLLPAARGDGSDPGPWLRAREAVLGTGRTINPWAFGTHRDIGRFETIPNCLGDAFVTAARTLEARVVRYGRSSLAVAEWLRAQDAVFANCSGTGDPVLPPPTPSTDPLVRADRAYQTAAAYFYATDYAAAEAHFRAIGDDARSPWQPYGRYLAARALIRRATVQARTEAQRVEFLSRAAGELRGLRADSSLAARHTSAQDLLDLIEARLRPVGRLHDLSAQLRADPSPGGQAVTDYVKVMDALVGDVSAYPYGAIARRDEMIAGDDLTDWIVAMQGLGPGAGTRALDRWREARAPHWLMAALWRLDPAHAAAPELLDAAARLDRASPAYATMRVLRLRLLLARGDLAAARADLADLPAAPSPEFPAEAVNLLQAARQIAAESLDDWLRALPRTAVLSGSTYGPMAEPLPNPTPPTFDVDAARILSERLPLVTIVQAAESRRLPDRLRVKVGIAAWTRAVLLEREAEARRVASTLRALAPPLAPDLDRYLAASSGPARHRAAILTLLRHSGLRPYVRLAEEVDTLGAEVSSPLSHRYGANWWCAFGETPGSDGGPYQESSASRLPSVFNAWADAPAFLTAADRRAAEDEWRLLAALATAPNYLADEAVRWARSAPADEHAAEALARAVQGTRWGCTNEDTGRFSQRAFATLHRLYPDSSWAKETRYWYNGR